MLAIYLMKDPMSDGAALRVFVLAINGTRIRRAVHVVQAGRVHAGVAADAKR